MTADENGLGADVRVFLRPLATSMPLGFLALAMATTVFTAVELGWIPTGQERVAGLVAVGLTAPLQLLASILGFLSRDPVAGTGLGVQAGTWALVGLVTVTRPPGTTSPGLGVLLVVAGSCVLVPALAGISKLAPALTMALTGTRYALTGAYELTGSSSWETICGWVGLVVAVAAVYTALALELEGRLRRTVLPVGRRGLARRAVTGRATLDAGEIAREPGVRPRL